MSLVGFAQVGLFVIALFYVLHEMKPVLLPLVLAIVVSLIVHPVYKAFRRIRIPRLLSAAATVSGLMALLLFGIYQAVLPGTQWLRSVDEAEVLGRVQEAFRPMKEVQAGIKQMADRVEEATKDVPLPEVDETEDITKEEAGGLSTIKPKATENKKEPKPKKPVKVKADESTKAPDPVKVEIQEDRMALLYSKSRELGVGLVAFLLMVLFILAYGNRVVRQLNRDTVVETMLASMGQDVSRYMFTIAVINAVLGVVIGVTMWGLGMPRPALWGVMAMVLNFIPYVGALSGTVVVFLAAAVSFDKPEMVVTVPVVYFVLTTVEGSLVTPAVLGERFRINPLIVFIWIFAWAGFWGIAGMLIAMPALVIFKIICENTEKMERFRRVFAA